MADLYDVLAVNLNDQKVRLLATGKTKRNAEAGSYNEGDWYLGEKR